MTDTSYIVSEFSRDGGCCSSQARTTIKRTSIRLFTLLELREYLRKRVDHEVSDLSLIIEDVLREKIIDAIIRHKSLRDCTRECLCGRFLFINRGSEDEVLTDWEDARPILETTKDLSMKTGIPFYGKVSSQFWGDKVVRLVQAERIYDSDLSDEN